MQVKFAFQVFIAGYFYRFFLFIVRGCLIMPTTVYFPKSLQCFTFLWTIAHYMSLDNFMFTALWHFILYACQAFRGFRLDPSISADCFAPVLHIFNISSGSVFDTSMYKFIQKLSPKTSSLVIEKK